MDYWVRYFMVKVLIYMDFSPIGISTGITGVWILTGNTGEMYILLMA
jgi:hypothetical protein